MFSLAICGVLEANVALALQQSAEPVCAGVDESPQDPTEDLVFGQRLVCTLITTCALTFGF